MQFGKMVTLGILYSLGLLAVVGSSAARGDATIGSPLIARSIDDLDAGDVYIYHGITSPFPITGTATSWSFYDANNTGFAVTPLIFHEVSGAYVITGVGTTRFSTGSGVQSYAFGLTEGSAFVGTDYTFGFTDRAYTVSGQQLVAGQAYTGAVDFTYATSDPWSYSWSKAPSHTPSSIALGQIYGTGGYTLDADPVNNGRIYSASMTVVAPEPASLGIGATAAIGLLLRKHRRSPAR